MNQIYPYPIPGAQTNQAMFVADTTHDLGFFDKTSVDTNTFITVDYSQLIPAVTLANFTLRVTPGGSPNLGISKATLNTGKTQLTFLLSAGIEGCAYDVMISATLTTGEVRTDKLTVNVLGDDCGCTPLPTPPPVNGDVSGDGSIIVNTAPRFFVSGTIPVGANVLDRWYDTSNGLLYDYISNGITSLWQEAGSGGGGGGGGSNVTILSLQPIHPDGTTTVFNLTSVVGRPVTISGGNTVFVSVDGVWQDAVTQYTAVNNQIAFAQAPSADSIIFMLWFAPYLPSI
jgi:hypothetical protein